MNLLVFNFFDIVFVIFDFFASAAIEARLLHIAAGLVRSAPPDEERQENDDRQKRTPELNLHDTVKQMFNELPALWFYKVLKVR